MRNRFKVGQKVVCIKTHSQKAVIKGKIYTITGLTDECNCDLVTVGILNEFEVPTTRVCSLCEETVTITNIQRAFDTELFAPLEDDGCSKELVEEFIEELQEELQLIL